MDDKKQFCHLCAFSDHKNHKILTIEEAAKNAKSDLLNVDFQVITDEITKNIKKIDGEMMELTKTFLYNEKSILQKLTKIKDEHSTKMKEFTNRKEIETNNLEIIEKVTNNVNEEENFDLLIDWNNYLKEKNWLKSL